jgi:hypothetical protein
VLSGLLALDRSGFLKRLTKEQHFLGYGGFTGIRVRDDSKGPSLIDFIEKILVCHV